MRSCTRRRLRRFRRRREPDARRARSRAASLLGPGTEGFRNPCASPDFSTRPGVETSLDAAGKSARATSPSTGVKVRCGRGAWRAGPAILRTLAPTQVRNPDSGQAEERGVKGPFPMLPFKLVYSDGYDLNLGAHVFPSQKY